MRYILLLITLFTTTLLPAQQPDLVFHHLTEKDGLSYNIINCFLKDSKGVLWIGTYNGLNRYDGAHFYIFRKGKDSATLPNNTVHELAEDKKGNIWGATDGGIFCYNQQKRTFKSYHTPGENDWPAIMNILCDKRGEVWATNHMGLIRYNSVVDSFELAPAVPGKPKDAGTYNVNKNGLAESPDGKGFWLACHEGLWYYDKSTSRFTSKLNDTDSVLYNPRSASGLCATSFGHYWYFDNKKKRLVGFDPVNKKVQYVLQPKEFEKIYYVATVFEDNNHLLWICTWGYELFTIDYLNGGEIKRITHNKNDLSSIRGDFFWAAMHEGDGTLWLGTVGGISRCNTNHSFYKVHRFTDSLFYKTNPAVEFVSDNKNDSSWWFTTNKDILVRYNASNATTTSYPFSKIPANKKGLHPAHVNRLLFLKEKTFLFSDYGAWVKEGNQQFKPLALPGIGDSVLLKDGAILADSILYCTDTKALWSCNLRTNQVTLLHYRSRISINGVDPVIVYLTPVGKKLWMLNGYDWLSYVEGNEIVPVKFSSIEKDGSNGYYTSMAADKRGNLWITKKGDGMFYYNPAEKKYAQYKQYDGLVMDHVMAASADHSGKIWAVAYNQYSVYNPLLNSFYNFTLPLNANNYNYVNFMATLSNGNIISNIADKIVEFYPGRLKAYSVNTLPIISMVNVAGDERFVIDESELRLSPDENSVLIKFGLLADNEASPYDMLYILEGSEKNWSVAGSNFEATYNSLQPGDYTFKVKALAKDKSWQTKEALLKIHVGTPFYKSWWFITLLACICATGIYAFYRYRLHQQQQLMRLEGKAQLLEKEKTTVMYESLKQQLNPHFLFNSLTSLSGLIEMDQKLAGNFLEQMSKLYRYILKSSENETVPLKDEINFVKLFISLQKTRFKKGLEVNVNVQDEYLHYKIAPVTLQNMMENAIKHNVIDVESPLVIDMFVNEEYLVVRNNLQRKNVVETSNGQGLANLRSLYHYLSDRPILIEEDEHYFAIKIPLI